MTAGTTKKGPEYVFAPRPVTTLPVQATATSLSTYEVPIHRVYCVGKNYKEHVEEMGGDPERETPIFFTKPADAVVCCPGAEYRAPDAAATSIAYPMATSNLHYEVELVLVIGKAGSRIDVEHALEHVFGYAVGVDLTRRDLQAQAKARAGPWDSAKAFDHAAPCSPVCPVETLARYQVPTSNGAATAYEMLLAYDVLLDEQSDNTVISLEVNGEERQMASLRDMTWSIPEIVSMLSHQFVLQQGDLIFTGTPSGVGPLEIEDTVVGKVGKLPTVEFTIVE